MVQLNRKKLHRKIDLDSGSLKNGPNKKVVQLSRFDCKKSGILQKSITASLKRMKWKSWINPNSSIEILPLQTNNSVYRASPVWSLHSWLVRNGLPLSTSLILIRFAI